VAIPLSLGKIYRLDNLWAHHGDGPSRNSSNGSSSFQPHTQTTAREQSGLLVLVVDLRRHSRGKLTTFNKGLTELLGTLLSDGDDEKMTGGRSVGEII
jgi:hypothetical protein